MRLLPAPVSRLAFTLSMAAACAGFAPAAWSAPPTAESIDTLLALTKTEKLLDSASAEVERTMRMSVQAGMQGRAPTEREAQIIDTMVRDSAALIREDMGWATMRPLILQIYQETFSQDEVDGQIAFYRTPVGAAVIDKMPAVMQASMAATQQRMQTLMPRLQAIARKGAAEARAAAAGAKAD